MEPQSLGRRMTISTSQKVHTGNFSSRSRTVSLSRHRTGGNSRSRSMGFASAAAAARAVVRAMHLGQPAPTDQYGDEDTLYQATNTTAVADGLPFARLSSPKHSRRQLPSQDHSDTSEGRETSDTEATQWSGFDITDVLEWVSDRLHDDDDCVLACRLKPLRTALRDPEPSNANGGALFMALVRHSDNMACILCLRGLRGEGLDTSLSFSVEHVVNIDHRSNFKLHGNGSFTFEDNASSQKEKYGFRLASVLSLWTAIASIHGFLEASYQLSDDWGWTQPYRDMMKADHTSQWYDDGAVAGADSDEESEEASEPSKALHAVENSHLSVSNSTPSESDMERDIIPQLKRIMAESDLDTLTSKEVRIKLEEHFGTSLKAFKSYIDQQMIVAFGQMAPPSQILDFLYLGTEWNACNMEELEANNVKAILNVTEEVPSFFPQQFRYKRIDLADEPESDLLSHWSGTCAFLHEAKVAGHSVLVHCKMGVSRSASTVIAFVMQMNEWSLEQAHDFVHGKRDVVKPNSGFWEQLKTWEHMLQQET